MTLGIDWRDIERGTATRASRRELHVLKTALWAASPETALPNALAAHQEWLQRLLGCAPELVAPYISWRREMVERFGLMKDQDFLTDATECVLHLIRQGEKINVA